MGKMTPAGLRSAALGTQISALTCAPDGLQLLAKRLPRAGRPAFVKLHPQTLDPVDVELPFRFIKARWLPISTVDTAYATRGLIWRVGRFGQGLFVSKSNGGPQDMPPPFNDPKLTVTAFAISPDERLALVGNASGFVAVFDTAMDNERFGQRLHRGHVTAACFAPDGKQAFTGSAGGELCAIDLPQ